MRVCIAAVIAIVAGCAPIPLSSQEEELVTVTDNGNPVTSYSFGTVLVSGSASHPFAVGPSSGSDDDYLLSIAFQNACPDFTLNAAPPMMWEICGTGVGHTCTPFPFSVTFAPQSPGMQSCKVVLDTVAVVGTGTGAGTGTGEAVGPGSGSGSNGGGVSLLLDGTGSAATFDFQVNPSSLDFGSVTVPTTSTSQSFTVKNVGNQSISIDPTPSGQTMVYGITPTPGPLNLAVGGSQRYDVTCTPALGANPASYTFTSPSLQIAKTLTLSCSGVATSLSLAPNPIAFGTVLYGGSVAAVPITITNTGSTPLQITNIGLGAGTSSDVSLINPPSMISLNPGAVAQNAFSVAYSAATLQDPGTLGKLTFHAGADNFEFPITGGTLIGAVGTNPASVDFGPVCVTRTATQDVDVYASGRADVSVSLDPNSPPMMPFSAMLPTGMLTGGHGTGATLAVSAHPTDTDLGPLSTQVVIDTNIPGEPTYTIDVAATGVPPGISATPASLEFGDVVTNTTSNGKVVDLSNCSGTPLMVTSAVLSGDDPGSFAIVSPNQIAETINDSDSETFLIVMSPHTSGIKKAQIDITDSTGVHSATLHGNGVEPPVDRETYYACSSSNGRAAWPIGLVVVLTVGRRRRSRARARTSEYPSAR